MNSTSVAHSGPRPAVLLAGLILALASPVAAETDGTITRTFGAAPDGKLVVDINMGGIDVKGTSGSQVVVTYTRRVSAGSTEDEEKMLQEHVVTMEQSGDTITVSARGPKWNNGGSFWRSLFGGGSTRKFHLTVSVPEQFNVDLKTSGGGIDVAHLTGTVRANTSGGGLDFSDINGDIDGHTSGGGIDLERCRGEVVVHTSGGGIEAEEGSGSLSLNTSGGGISVTRHEGDVKARTSGGGIRCTDIAGNVDASTSGGSIRAEMTIQPTGNCRFETSGGGVTLTLPANAAVTLDASTSGGGVSSDLPVTVTGEHKKNQLRGPINGGGPEMRLRSSGGSIRVEAGSAVEAS